MTQAERDRLVTLRKAKKRLITQREAAEELGVTVRQVKRLLKALKRQGDRAVIHGLRGRASVRKIGAGTQRKAIEVLGTDVYRGFGPTLAAEYLARKHAIVVSRETLRQWMLEAGLWKGRQQKLEKRRRDEPGVDKDVVEMPPTQIGRALRELDIVWIPAHSPQAKGRVERGFSTAQDRLVKGMRIAKVKTLAQANQYLATEFLPWWNETLTVIAENQNDAHRPLEKRHDLAAILSHVETRQVKSDYTLRFEAESYQIERTSIRTGMRGARVRVEKRLDGSVAVRFGERYLTISQIPTPKKIAPQVKRAAAAPRRGSHAGGKSQWMKNFHMRGGPTMDEAIAISNATR